MKGRHLLPAVAAAAALAAAGAARAAGPGLARLADIAGGDAGGRWTSVGLDPARQRGYVARTGGIGVIDLAGLRALPDLLAGHRVNAVLPLPQDGLLATGGDSGTVTILDAGGAVRATIRGLGDPDEAILEPGTARALVVDEDRGMLVEIDPAAGTVLRRIPVGPKPEMAQADADGHAWVNLRTQHALAAVDLRRGVVTGHYPLAGCQSPSGLAEFPERHRLVAACGNGVAKVLRDTDGADLGTVPVGPHPGNVLAVGRQAWMADEEGTLSAIELAPVPRLAARYGTRQGSRVIGYDPSARRLYLPHGALVGQGDARQLLPGSFGVLVLGVP